MLLLLPSLGQLLKSSAYAQVSALQLHCNRVTVGSLTVDSFSCDSFTFRRFNIQLRRSSLCLLLYTCVVAAAGSALVVAEVVGYCCVGLTVMAQHLCTEYMEVM
jgi:hypothetical protein